VLTPRRPQYDRIDDSVRLVEDEASDKAVGVRASGFGNWVLRSEDVFVKVPILDSGGVSEGSMPSSNCETSKIGSRCHLQYTLT